MIINESRSSNNKKMFLLNNRIMEFGIEGYNPPKSYFDYKKARTEREKK